MKYCILASAIILGAAIVFAVHWYTHRTRFFFLESSGAVGDRVTGGIYYKGELRFTPTNAPNN